MTNTVFSSGKILGITYSMVNVNGTYEVDINTPSGVHKKMTTSDEVSARRWIDAQVNNFIRNNYNEV
jgi:hypothetical protein